jgi:hypothetical protein
VKRKLLGAVVALFASASFGATLNSIQLLNPVGSTSGQAIVSTGATTAPAWGQPTFTYPSQSANTVLANATTSSTAPSAFAMPGCSAAANALTWTTSTGFTCNTSINAATLSGNAIGTSGNAVPLLSGTNTWSGAQGFSGNIIPTSTVGIQGTTTNDSPAVGSWGYNYAPSTSGTSMTTNTPVNCASQAVSAGQWGVAGVIIFSPSAASPAQLIAGANTASATLPTAGLYTSLQFAASTLTAGGSQAVPAPFQVIKLAASGTIYLVGQMGFGSGTATCAGTLQIWRMR